MRFFLATTLIATIINAEVIEPESQTYNDVSIRSAELFNLTGDVSTLDLILSSAVVEAYKQTFGPAVNLAESFYKSTVTILLDLLTCKPVNMAPVVFYDTVKETIESFSGGNGSIDKAVHIDEFIRKLREKVEIKSPIDIQGFVELSNDIHRILINYPFITVGAYLEYLSKVLIIIENMLDVPKPNLKSAAIPLRLSPDRMPLVPNISIDKLATDRNSGFYHPSFWDFNKYGFTGTIGNGIWSIPQNIHSIFGDLIRATHILPFTIDVTPDPRWALEKTNKIVVSTPTPVISTTITPIITTAPNQIVVTTATPIIVTTPELNVITSPYPNNNSYISTSQLASAGHHYYTKTGNNNDSFLVNYADPHDRIQHHHSVNRSEPIIVNTYIEPVVPVSYGNRSINNMVDNGEPRNTTYISTALNDDNSAHEKIHAVNSDDLDARFGMSAPNAAIFGHWQTLFNPAHSGMNALGAYSAIKADMGVHKNFNTNSSIRIETNGESESTNGEGYNTEFVWSVPDAAVYFLQKLEIFRPQTMDPVDFLIQISDIIKSTSFTLTPSELARKVSASFGNENLNQEFRDQAISFVSTPLSSTFPRFSDILEHITAVVDSRLTKII